MSLTQPHPGLRPPISTPSLPLQFPKIKRGIWGRQSQCQRLGGGRSRWNQGPGHDGHDRHVRTMEAERSGFPVNLVQPGNP